MSETPSSSGTTSLSLLERARCRDSEAWRRLVQLYSPLVFYWARRIGLGEADAADLVQDVWHSVTTTLERFQRDPETGTFRGWLWTIARNKANDFYRKRASLLPTGGTDAQQLFQNIANEEPEDDTGVENHGLLHRALELIRPEFQEQTWRAFWRMTVDGWTAKDTGQELGMAANAVHQSKFRVLRRLREEMAGLVAA